VPDSLNYEIQIADTPNSKVLFGGRVAATYSNILILGRTFFQLFAFLGLILLFSKNFFPRSPFRSRQISVDRNLSLDLLGIGIGALVVGFIARTSGSLGPSYNPERVAFQVAIVLIIPTALAIEFMLFRKRFIQIFSAIPVLFFLIVLLFQATSLGGYITGSDVTRISNLQRDYSPFVISESERSAARWLAANFTSNSYLQTDSRGFLVLLQNGQIVNSTSLDPVNLVKGSYIYAANSNVVGEVARAPRFIVFPEDYIDKHYQIIYSSNRARIYH
jgi:hypothetical protein